MNRPTAPFSGGTRDSQNPKYTFNDIFRQCHLEREFGERETETEKQREREKMGDRESRRKRDR